MEQLETEWPRLRRLTDVGGGREEEDEEEEEDREKDGHRVQIYCCLSESEGDEKSE